MWVRPGIMCERLCGIKWSLWVFYASHYPYMWVGAGIMCERVRWIKWYVWVFHSSRYKLRDPTPSTVKN